MYIMDKSQISMEFIILLGFILIVSIPLIVIYYGYSNETKFELSQNQAMKIAHKIVDNAESVFYLGEPSKTTIKVSMPENIDKIIIHEKEVVFIIRYKGMPNDIVVDSPVSLSGNLSSSSGIRYITIKASGNNVVIKDS